MRGFLWISLGTGESLIVTIIFIIIIFIVHYHHHDRQQRCHTDLHKFSALWEQIVHIVHIWGDLMWCRHDLECDHSQYPGLSVLRRTTAGWTQRSLLTTLGTPTSPSSRSSWSWPLSWSSWSWWWSFAGGNLWGMDGDNGRCCWCPRGFPNLIIINKKTIHNFCCHDHWQ